MEHPSELIDSNTMGKLTYLPSLMGLEIASDDVTIVHKYSTTDYLRASQSANCPREYQ
jgi:hypothetical protein